MLGSIMQFSPWSSMKSENAWLRKLMFTCWRIDVSLNESKRILPSVGVKIWWNWALLSDLVTLRKLGTIWHSPLPLPLMAGYFIFCQIKAAVAPPPAATDSSAIVKCLQLQMTWPCFNLSTEFCVCAEASKHKAKSDSLQLRNQFWTFIVGLHCGFYWLLRKREPPPPNLKCRLPESFGIYLIITRECTPRWTHPMINLEQ